MINFKKMDDKDFVFVNKPLTEKEEKEFSDYLKSRKTKKRRTTSKKMEKATQLQDQ
jgi:hypothetical protein